MTPVQLDASAKAPCTRTTVGMSACWDPWPVAFTENLLDCGTSYEVPWSVLGWGEEVDEQLVDAFVLVVVDPVRGIGEALDAVKVGHVVVLGLGQLFAEVAVALPPDHQR